MRDGVGWRARAVRRSAARGSPGAAPGTRANHSGFVDAAGALVAFAAVLAAWELIAASGAVAPQLVPAPAAVAGAAAHLFGDEAFLADLATSTWRLALGLALGAVAGAALHGATAHGRASRALLSPLRGMLRAVPATAWLPVLALYLGVGDLPKVAILALGSATVLASGAGLRAAVAQCWLLLVASEALGASAGVGQVLAQSAAAGRTDRVLAVIVVLAVLGLVTDRLVVLGRHVTRRFLA